MGEGNDVISIQNYKERPLGGTALRTTVLERVDCRRLVSYDADNHDILDKSGRVEFKLLAVENGLLRMRFDFAVEIRNRRDGELWALIEGSAVTEIHDPSIKETALDASGDLNLEENVEMLIEGAMADEILLPLSEVARAMKLPGLLSSPIRFRGALLEKPDDSQVGSQASIQGEV